MVAILVAILDLKLLPPSVMIAARILYIYCPYSQ